MCGGASNLARLPGQATTGGRGLSRRWLAFDIGGTKVAAALVTETGELVHEMRQPTRSADNTQLAAQLADICRELLAGTGIAADELDGVGVAMPGRVDPVRNMAVSSSNMGYNNLEIGAVMAAVTAAPVALENDGNAGALGEKWFGAGRGLSNFAYVCVGTGVGGGLVLGGRLYTGAAGRAGEAGHMIVDLHGVSCRCGATGCVEAMASGVGIPALAARLLGETAALRLGGGSLPRADQVYAAAAGGDQDALVVTREIGLVLGAMALNIIRLLDVERVIFGGGVAAAGSLFLESVYAGAKELGRPFLPGIVALSPLGGNSGLLGAAAAVEEKVAGG